MDLAFSLISLLILVYSAIFHEIAHGLVAERLGDPTARIMGRLTLNPKSHIDPIMSIALPLLLIISGSPVVFGAAKPVPVDPFNLRDGRKDLALVSLAGPATNILIAIVFAVVIKIVLVTSVLSGLPPDTAIFILKILVTVVHLNLLLAIFNIIPLPPLDGSKIFSLLLPEREAAVYLSFGSIGFFIIFFLLVFPIGGFSLNNFIGSLLMFSERLLGL